MAMAAPPLHLCYLSWSSSATFQSPSPLFLPQFCCSHNSKEPLLPFALEVCAGRRNHSDSMKLQQGKGWSNRRHGDLKDLEHHVKDQMKNNLIVGGRSAVKLESLRIDQAIGQVMTAQANFMRVIVENAGQDAACTSIMHSRGDDISCESSLLSDEQVKTLDSSHSGYGGAAEHVKYIVDGDNIAALDSCSLAGHGNFQRHAVDDKGTFNLENVAIDAVNDEGITNLVNVSVDAERTREPKSGRELLCVVRAVLKKIKRKVMVGDRVLVSGIDWTAGRGMVEDVFARKSQIIDPPVANVDHLLVLFAMDKPRLDPMTLSRFLVEAESTRINFTLVLNKVDLVPLKVAQMWEERLSCWGYKPIFCSAETHSGIDSLVPLLKDRTSVVVGPSGVGKSSLINSFRNEGSKESFLDEKFTSFDDNYIADKGLLHDNVVFEKLLVSEVSQRSGRGRHTTRNVSLFHLPIAGGVLADTPGFSHPGLGKVTSGSLAQLFPEVVMKLANSESSGCAFANCLHVGEPNCIVGGDWDRYPHYLSLLEEVKKREEFEKKTLGTKRESDVRYKVGASGIKQAEPMLVSKTHRRISRRQVKQTLENDIWEEENH